MVLIGFKWNFSHWLPIGGESGLFSILYFIKLLAYFISYIRNWSLQPFGQDHDLASYTTYVVCVLIL